jgi:tetratricopeptide (TPR) repeat protein
MVTVEHIPENAARRRTYPPRVTKLFIVSAALLFCGRLYAGENIDRELERLDEIIRNQQEYDAIKERNIENLIKLTDYVSRPEQLFKIYMDLAGEYSKYDTDLSLKYADTALAIARDMHDDSLAGRAMMLSAEINAVAGFQVEALQMMERVDKKSLPHDLRPQYYHTYRTIYGIIAMQAPSGERREHYTAMAARYRDSLRTRLGEDDIALLFVTTDEMIENGDYAEALELLSAEYDRENATDHVRAILSYSIGEAHMRMGNTDSAKYYLAISSANDLRSSIREYRSLQNLAYILFEDGDIERAYTYINKAINDALKANAKINIPFISTIIPVITEAYDRQMKAKERQLNSLVWFISLLVLALLVTVFIIWRQMRKATTAERRESEANERLTSTNVALTEVNDRLRLINGNLAESNRIKETYVGRYMDICSDYIDRVDKYRSTLNKIARNEGTAEVMKALGSKAYMEDELRAFYENFDATFLHLFPDFVEQFNALLKPGERIVPRAGKLLNSQLRVFALVRLGITDSVKIAEFLRYSVNTIYNYRVKMRNAALNERDDFEAQVARIGGYD